MANTTAAQKAAQAAARAADENAVLDPESGVTTAGQVISTETGTAIMPPVEQDARAFSTATPSSRIDDIKDRIPSKGDRLVERIVLTDGYDWVLRDPADPKVVVEQGLRVRGDVVAVTEAEAKRGKKNGHLGDEADLKRIIFGVESVENRLRTDEEIAAMTPVEILAYLANHTDELGRVAELEEFRAEGPREAVEKAIKTVRDFLEG